MVADIDLVRAFEPVGRDFVGAEQDHDFGLRGFNVGDPALLCVAEDQRGHARGRRVEDVEAVPAVFDEPERLHQRQPSAKPACRERSRPDNDRRLCRVRECVGDFLRQLAEQLQVVAEPFDLHSEVDFGPDREDLAALARDLAHAGGDQRRFPADVRADQQHRVRALDPGDGRVERDRAQARRVVGEPRLAPFQQVRALALHQLPRRIHRLGIEQVAGDRRDPGARLLQPGGENLQRFLPVRLAQLVLLTDPRPVEAVAHQRIDVVARLIADPLLVHVLVDARQDAHHLTLADVEADVRPDRVHDVDAGHPAQLPGAALENLRFLQQRADRANVGEVTGKLTADRML